MKIFFSRGRRNGPKTRGRLLAVLSFAFNSSVAFPTCLTTAQNSRLVVVSEPNDGER